MPRKILIVDDNDLNREMLKSTLVKDYDVLEAANGVEALATMHRHYKMLSAVLLDIVMPEMDGYEVLRRVRDNALLAQIPILIVTGSNDEATRVKALSLGANDFILKPFNPDIVKHCLRNNIALRETASILNAIQKDKLTGLYNREAFFDKVTALIREREPGHYILSCFDIDNFKLINDQFGAEEGDRILREIGRATREEMAAIDGVAGRISADNFSVLYPADKRDIDMAGLMKARGLVLLERTAVVFSVGRYLVTDLSLSASAIYDRAYIAKQSVKGRYDKHLAYFDEEMLARLVLNQQITGEMEAALAQRQFEVWFQPQYNHATGLLVGAEALARWRHPQKGIVPPGNFIPLFEQTGFVYELDKYVWREVCRYLRKWIDEGREPLPVSVNVSRYDVFRADLIAVITGLVREYDIPEDLLRLEITESAFSTSTDVIVEIVKELIALGFTIEIDDFGSGYSSLNTLKNVPAQVVKLDMRFLEGDDRSTRGGNILESIVRMTKWLGMTVLAEGVEGRNQADFLKSIGCTYVQGYLYARPMPAERYEALLRGESADAPLALERVRGLDGASFWDPNGLDSLIFNNYADGACVYEYRSGSIEMIRASDQYARTVFGPGMRVERLMRVDWIGHAGPGMGTALRRAMEQSIETGREVRGEYLFENLPGCPRETWLRSTLRVIASAGDRHLIYCTSENITAQRQAERKNAVSREQMQAILDNVEAGIAAAAVSADAVELIFANDRLFEILGYPRERFQERFGRMPGPVCAEDRDLVFAKMEEARQSASPVRFAYRLLREDGRTVWVSHRVVYMRFSGFEAPIRLSVLNDITAEKLARECMTEAETQQSLLINSILGGIATYEGELEQDQELTRQSGEGFSFAARSGGEGALEVRRAESDTAAGEKTSRDVAGIPGIALVSENCRLRLTYFSDGFCRLFGYTRGEWESLAAENPLGPVAAGDLPQPMEQMRALISAGQAVDCIYRARAKDGGYRWINLKSVLHGRRGETATIYSVLFDVTERQEALERLRVREEENRLAIAHSRNVVCRYDVAARTLAISPRVNPIFTAPALAEDVPYGPIRAGQIAPDSVETYAHFYESIRRGEKNGEMVFQRQSTLGWRWLEARFSTISADDGRPVSAVISFEDVTENLEKEAVYKRWRWSIREKAPETYSLFRLNVSKKTVVSAREGALLPIPFKLPSDDMDEQTSHYAEQYVLEEDRPRFAATMEPAALLAAYHRGKRKETLDYRERTEGADYRWLRLTIDLMESPLSRDIEAYLLFENIDESKRAELATIERAERDPLTGVLNRAVFADRVDAFIRDAGPEARHALLMLDLDGFKLVNDAFGHAAGDQALIDVAEQLRAMSRGCDLIGRLGGDEFVVFLPDIPGDGAAAAKARRICEQTRKSFSLDVQISGSVGIVVCPRDGTDFETLYRKADTTLYYVKGSGKNNYAFYHEEMVGGPHKPAAVKPTAIEILRWKNRKRMLIVDDNQLDYELLANLFRNDYLVERAGDGQTALIRLRHYGSAISVVLLDLLMPGMDGFTVLEKMRQSVEMRTIPVVVVSVDDNRTTSLRAIRAGAADYVTKPVDPDILRIRVQSAVSKAENERLRAKNSFLELQGNEMTSYKTVLSRLGLAVAELDWGKGSFVYSPSMADCLAGKYDGRSLWHILLSDLVADARVVKRMQQYVHNVAEERARTEGSIVLPLKTADGKKHQFRLTIYKLANEYGLTDKLVLTFHDLDAEVPKEET